MVTVMNSYTLFEEARRQGPNPFAKDRVIADAEVWGEIVSDLPAFNQHINQQLNQIISEIRQKYITKIGVVVKGERGSGKSHAIRRIWKKIEGEGGALFSYISPCSNPKIFDAHVRFQLVESFKHHDSQGVSQWQRFAATLISTLKNTEYEEAYQEYIEKCDQPDELKKYVKKINGSSLVDFFSALAEAIQENQPDLDFYFTKAVLLTLLGAARPAQVALSWIKGEDDPDIKKTGLPELSQDQQAARNIWVIKQICKLAKVALLPVVIWFDQAEAWGSNTESGDGYTEAIARCIDRIYFDCNNVILLLCLHNDDWRQIEKMQGGTRDRIGKVLDAIPPTSDQIVELVQMRLNWFYKNKHLNPSDYPPLYPFEESQIRNIAKLGAGVRQLIDQCANAFAETLPDPKEKLKKQFLDTYNELLGKVSLPTREDEKIAAIVSCAMKMVSKSGVADVVINEIRDIGISATHDLHLVISGYDSSQQKQVSIGIRICEAKNAKTFNAVMKRLTDYKKYKITRGCLVRSTPVPLSWRVGQQLKQQLVNQQGGEVVVFSKEDIKPLAALERIYEQSADYGFEREELFSIVQELGLVDGNPLIHEILSAPVTA